MAVGYGGHPTGCHDTAVTARPDEREDHEHRNEQGLAAPFLHEARLLSFSAPA